MDKLEEIALESIDNYGTWLRQMILSKRGPLMARIRSEMARIKAQDEGSTSSGTTSTTPPESATEFRQFDLWNSPQSSQSSGLSWQTQGSSILSMPSHVSPIRNKAPENKGQSFWPSPPTAHLAETFHPKPAIQKPKVNQTGGSKKKSKTKWTKFTP